MNGRSTSFYSFSNYIIKFVTSLSTSTFTSTSTSTYLLMLLLIILLLLLISLIKYTKNTTAGFNIFISITMDRQLVTKSSNFTEIRLEIVTNQFGNSKYKLVLFLEFHDLRAPQDFLRCCSSV